MMIQQLDELRQMATTCDWQGDFQNHLSATGASEATVRAYLQDLRGFAQWFERNNGQAFQAELITGVDLRQYAAEQIGVAAPASWNRRRTALAAFCGWLQATGALNYNPFQGVPRAEQEEPAPRWLSENEVHKLERTVELHVNGERTTYHRLMAVRDQAMIALMLHAGLREAEVCGLDWSDVQFSERKNSVMVRNGKGRKRRLVPLNREAKRALRLWQEVSGSDGAVFSGRSGRIGTRLVQQRVSALRQEAGLDQDVTGHSLRHTFAKRMLDSGVPLTGVAKLLGHARLDTTARYVQPGWEDLEKFVERI